MYNNLAKYLISLKQGLKNQMCTFVTVLVLTKTVVIRVVVKVVTKCTLLPPFKMCYLLTQSSQIIININRINQISLFYGK